MKNVVPLYEYQKRWLNDESRFKIGMFARQRGKTFTTTLEIVLDCLEAEARGEKRRWVILSRGERQAREAMNEGVKRHLEAINIVLKSYNEEYLEDLRVLAHEAVLSGGSKITALPANADTARGFSANVYLDEFAFHKDSRQIWKAVFPIVSAGHRLRITSTPNGKGNMFYTLFSAHESPFSKHVCDIYEAVKQGLPRDVEALKRTIGDAQAWEQEYELRWVDEASAWLSYDLIASVEERCAGSREGYAGGLCYVGEDIARRGDLWVLWVSELVGDVLWTREVIARRNISFAEQDAIRHEVMQRYRVARICIDQTGMGEKPVEDAKRKYGEYVVEGVLFTGANKQHVATVAKQRFEDKRIRIPQGDEALRKDLHSLQRISTPTGGVRFDASRDEGSHADRAWACFLSMYAGSREHQRPRYEKVEMGVGSSGFGRGRAL